MAKFHAFTFALLTTALTSQSTWIVDPSGNGDFTDLYNAQVYAAPGDTLILVGSMQGINLTKRLNLVAHGATITTGLTISTSGSVSVSGGDFHLIHVGNSTVSCNGVTARLTMSGSSAISAHDSTFATTHQLAVWQPAVTIPVASRVVFDGCTIKGADPWIGVFYPPGGTAALKVEGKATLRDCNVIGGANYPGPISLPGGPAIDLGGAGAVVDAKDCSLSGGHYELVVGTGLLRLDNTAPGTTAATVTIATAELPWMTGTSAYAGGTMNINVDSTSSTLATISASLGMNSPIPTVIGDVWLAPAYVPVTAGITDANGEIATTISVPTMITRGLTVTFQGVVFPAAGGITATAPAILHVL